MRPFQRRRSLLLSLIISSLYPRDIIAANSFIWGFNIASINIVECSQLQVFLGNSASLTATAKGPFTMFAYEASGLTTVQTLGSDPNNLFWTVDHPPNSQLILSMLDGNKNSGGVAGQLLNVVAGDTESCHAANPISPVSITTNTTKNLQTCDVLPLKVSGGQPPYTVSVVALGAQAVENVTIPNPYDTLDWVNRASPGTKLLASISDSQGVYAAATNLLTTFGTTDLTCQGMLTTQLNSTDDAISSALAAATAPILATPSDNFGVTQPTDPTNSTGNTAASSSNSSRGAILGASIGGAILFGVLCVAGLFYYKRRTEHKNSKDMEFQGDEVMPFVLAPPPSGPDTGGQGTMPSSLRPGSVLQISMRDGMPTTPTSLRMFASPMDGRPPSDLMGSVMAVSSPSLTTAYAVSAHPSLHSSSNVSSGSGYFLVQNAGADNSDETTALVAGSSSQTPRGEKGLPRPQRLETLYQHADIEDASKPILVVAELPPAYKSR